MTHIREARDRLAWGGSPPETNLDEIPSRLAFRGWTISDGRFPGYLGAGWAVDARLRDGGRLNAVYPLSLDWSHMGRASDIVAWRFTAWRAGA
jgi:hypothetical protein